MKAAGEFGSSGLPVASSPGSTGSWRTMLPRSHNALPAEQFPHSDGIWRKKNPISSFIHFSCTCQRLALAPGIMGAFYPQSLKVGVLPCGCSAVSPSSQHSPGQFVWAANQANAEPAPCHCHTQRHVGVTLLKTQSGASML